MKNRFTRACSLTGAVALAACASGIVFAQDDAANAAPARAVYTVLPPKPAQTSEVPAAGLPTWSGSFTYKGRSYTYNMVGTDPSTGATTNVVAEIIPLKIEITVGGKTYTFSPNVTVSDGKTVTQNTVDSPLFDATTTYIQGGVNVGTTQYEDAYQRANFWGTVSSNPGYHVLLTPKVRATQTIVVAAGEGTVGKPFGSSVGEVDINWLDAQLTALITKLKVTPNTFPIFLANDIYLTSGGCCIGGYHSATGNQTYAYTSYITYPGEFAQDVSALSHEIGEWLDDPLLNGGNNSPCGILENGDPLENNANYGAYPYMLNGFKYNLQDLVTLPYFGAPPATTVNDQFTFQGEKLRVCQNGS